MTLAALAQLILRLLSEVLSILGIVTGISNDLKPVAVEHQPYALETIAANAANTVNHPTWGNEKLYDLLVAIQTALDLQPILDAIAALPAGSDIIIPSEGDNAQAVWLYQADYRDRTGNMLSKLDANNVNTAPVVGYPIPAAPWFGWFVPTTFSD